MGGSNSYSSIEAIMQPKWADTAMETVERMGVKLVSKASKTDPSAAADGKNKNARGGVEAPGPSRYPKSDISFFHALML